MTADGAGIPAEQTLIGLGADDWSLLLGHARAALNDLDDSTIDATIKRLRSAPAGRLAGGRMRRDLVQVLTRRTGLWADVRDRLAADDAAQGLAWLVAGDPPPSRPQVSTAPGTSSGDRRREDHHATKDRRKDRRLQEAREQRDALRRQLAGAEARAIRAEETVAGLEGTITELRSQVDKLQGEVDAERARTDAVVEREQRRQAGRIAELEQDLTDVRRELDRIQQSRLAAERSREAAEQRRERGDAPAPVEEGSGVIAGRPSRLPPGLRLDTTEGATELLRAGRRILVDGWNVTKSNWAGLPFDQHRRRLVAELEKAAARLDLDVTVVFDGQGEGDQAQARGVRQVFTPDGTTADDDLVFRVAALADDEPVVVVTDDAELRERLAVYRPDLLHTRPFLWAIQ